MHFALEDVARHRAADQGGRDIVEEAREYEHDREQREAALPSVGQERRHLVRDAALLEMARQDRETHQQQEQVRQHHPLVLDVQRKAAEAGAGFESRERELVEDDGGEAGERDLERAVMEQRDAEQRQRKQDEVDRNAEDKDRRRRGRGGGGFGEHRNECGRGNEPEPRMRQRIGASDRQAGSTACWKTISARGHSIWIPVRHRSMRLPEGPGLVRISQRYRRISTFQRFENERVVQFGAPGLQLGEPHHLIGVDGRGGAKSDQRQRAGDIAISDTARVHRTMAPRNKRKSAGQNQEERTDHRHDGVRRQRDLRGHPCGGAGDHGSGKSQLRAEGFARSLAARLRRGPLAQARSGHVSSHADWLSRNLLLIVFYMIV